MNDIDINTIGGAIENLLRVCNNRHAGVIIAVKTGAGNYIVARCGDLKGLQHQIRKTLKEDGA